jgi:hypothetical protein
MNSRNQIAEYEHAAAREAVDEAEQPCFALSLAWKGM